MTPLAREPGGRDPRDPPRVGEHHQVDHPAGCRASTADAPPDRRNRYLPEVAWSSRSMAVRPWGGPPPGPARRARRAAALDLDRGGSQPRASRRRGHLPIAVEAGVTDVGWSAPDVDIAKPGGKRVERHPLGMLNEPGSLRRVGMALRRGRSGQVREGPHRRITRTQADAPAGYRLSRSTSRRSREAASFPMHSTPSGSRTPRRPCRGCGVAA